VNSPGRERDGNKLSGWIAIMLALMFIIPVSSMTGSADSSVGTSLFLNASSSAELVEPGDIVYLINIPRSLLRGILIK